MDVIRCDLPEYLVWKWSPDGNNSDRQNSIRWGSSLSVKDGEVAVFVYNQKGKPLYDYITGPYDQILKTDNFPVLATIIGWAYGGKSPFQAEVYFINLSGNNQIRFGIPYFDIFDSRFPEIGVPVAVRGTLTFNITDYIEFTKLNRLINFDLDDFQRQIKSMFVKAVKSVILQIPDEMKIPVVSIERKIEDINSRIQSILDKRLYNDFGVNLKVLDIEAIEINKASLGYRQLMSLTADITTNAYTTQANLNIQWMQEKQRLELENLENNLRIQREEAQRAQRLQTESKFINAHQIDMQAEVLKAGAESLGQMNGTVNFGIGGGVNPAGLMTEMAIGSAIGQQINGMMNSFTPTKPTHVPPTMPSSEYYVGIDGNPTGPISYSQLRQYAKMGKVTKESLVWKNGLDNWMPIAQVPELSNLFTTSPPPFPM